MFLLSSSLDQFPICASPFFGNTFTCATNLLILSFFVSRDLLYDVVAQFDTTDTQYKGGP